jgi:PAS domain S-box-containing protein
MPDLPTLISYIDSDQRYVLTNPAYRDWFGLPPEKVIGKTVLELLGKHDYELRRNYIEAALRGETNTFRVMTDHHELGRRETELTYTPSRDGEGTIKGFFVVGHDITEHALAGEAIQRGESRTRNILESITDSFIALDRNWRFTYVNGQAERVLDRTAGDLLGKIIWEEYPGLAGSKFENAYRRAMRDRVTVTVEDYYPDHERWYEVHAYPVQDGISVYFQDVTDRKRTQETILESETRYRTLFNQIDEGFCVIELIFDSEGRPLDYCFLEINPAFEKHTGLHNAAGKTMRSLAPDHDAHWFEIYGNVVRTGEPVRFEEEARALGRWFNVYAFRLDGPGSRKVAILFSDITESKQAEIALRKSEAMLRATQSLARVGGWELDLGAEDINRNALRWTDETFRIFGYAPGEIEVTNELFFGLVHPDDREAIAKALTTALREKKSYEITHRLVLPDGTERIVHEWADIVINDEGQPVQLMGACQDITERKKAEEGLYEAKERLRLMVESVKDYAIFSLDTAGRVTTWNHGAKEMFGFSADEIIGQPGSIIFTPEDRESKVPEQEMLTAMENGHAEDERWHMRRSGEQFFASGILASLRDDSWHLLGYVKIARDITHRKEAEEMLIEARNKADEANRAKSEFLANMSHEIRTPMNAVVGLSSILARTNDLSEKQQEIVSTLQLSAQSLMGLINDLLDIAKIETNKINLEHIPFRPGDIIGEVFGVLSPKAEEKGITLDRLASSLDEQRFLGDPLRIRQIVMNLVSNAIKFTESGGVIVSLSSTPHEEPEHLYVHITVSDTGIGIAANKLRSIFEKFIQADTSTTRKYGGTGLGLAISKNLAEIMGGGITVKSALGKGSEFTLHLPLQLADEAEPHAVSEPSDNRKKEVPPPEKRPCILLVEDYRPNVLVASSLLEALGYSVATAGNGKEALSTIRANRDYYAAVLMDVQMPGMDGLEVTRFVRQEEQERGLPRLPIIAVTAHALQGDRERCLAAGMDDYISKPFQPEELQKILSEVYDSVPA